MLETYILEPSEINNNLSAHHPKNEPIFTHCSRAIIPFGDLRSFGVVEQKQKWGYRTKTTFFARIESL